MKRYGNLYETICSWDNLLLASRKAQKGKRLKPNVARFNFRREEELLSLRKELLRQTYRPGDYHHFTIYEEKKRLISAAPYRDRVVHHALCNVIEPIFERTFIFSAESNSASIRQSLLKAGSRQNQQASSLLGSLDTEFDSVGTVGVGDGRRLRLGLRTTSPRQSPPLLRHAETLACPPAAAGC
jgi:hypothetical protein